MVERVFLKNEELAKFIDSATPNQLKEFFSVQSVNAPIEVEISKDLEFRGTAFSYAIFSSSTDASHVQALIECGADLNFEQNIDEFSRSQLFFLDQWETGRSQSFDVLEDASPGKREIIKEAFDRYRSRERSVDEVYEMLCKEDLSVVEKYFETHDPNAQVTMVLSDENLIYTGTFTGLAAFKDAVPGEAFKALMQAGGDPNVRCRLEGRYSKDVFDEMTVTEFCHSAQKINDALDHGGVPSDIIVDSVMYVMNKYKDVLNLELRLVNEFPDLIESRDMHVIGNPKAVAEMVLMGHDPNVLNDDGDNVMMGAILRGDYEKADALQQVGVPLTGPKGQRPMEAVSERYNELQSHVGRIRYAELSLGENLCMRAFDYLVDRSEDPSGDLSAYMKIGSDVKELHVVKLLDRGAMMNSENQFNYFNNKSINEKDKEAVQEALNRQQRDTILAEVGEVYTPPTMRRKM